MTLTITPVPARVHCPIAHCRFEQPSARAARSAGNAFTLPGGTVLAAPDAATGSFGVDRAGAHLAGGHSLAEWIGEVIRLRAILADPDHHVAAARELQQLALERARQAEAERDAARAECEQLRARLARATRSGKPGKEAGAAAVAAGRKRTTPSAPCPVCEREFYLRLDGRIRLHNKPGRSQPCTGSGALIEDPARLEVVKASA